MWDSNRSSSWAPSDPQVYEADLRRLRDLADPAAREWGRLLNVEQRVAVRRVDDSVDASPTCRQELASARWRAHRSPLLPRPGLPARACGVGDSNPAPSGLDRPRASPISANCGVDGPQRPPSIGREGSRNGSHGPRSKAVTSRIGGRRRVRVPCKLVPVFALSFPRRQQARRLRRAAASGVGSDRRRRAGRDRGGRRRDRSGRAAGASDGGAGARRSWLGAPGRPQPRRRQVRG